jgi:class II poly(R)-hydroxyalkanoic acid synthase
VTEVSDAPAARRSEAARPPRGATGAALDVLLTDAALGSPVARVLSSPAEALSAGLRLARRPDRIARRALGLGRELARVAAGRSELAPRKGDRRFGDPAWEKSWAFRRVLQAYLAAGETVDGLIDDAQLDWRLDRVMRFAAGNVHDLLSPTNFALLNPAVLKETIDQGGANLVKGARRAGRDLAARRLPAMVDTARFEVGGNIATTPGAVVLRTDVLELIQYAPQAKRVREVPLLFIPPTINKYYILDLAPDRSLVEHLLRQGQQVFMASWRNPDGDQGHFDFDTYAAAVLEAREAVAEITGADTVHLNAACSGGLISAGALAHLVETGELGEVASLSLLVSALDSARAGTTSALTNRELAAAAVAESARRGYLDGQALANVFAWLRPNDLVWGYVVNNYLMGKKPPAFDILYWNQDAVRLSAGLHRDFVRIALDNTLAEPGAMEVLGSPVDLGAIDLDAYVVAGLNDHIVPWENAYRGARLLGGDTRFVLSTSGHIQALINPPGPNSKSSFRVSHDLPADPETFVECTPVSSGSWWPDYVAWLQERSGDLEPARKELGSGAYPAVADAPGSYVHAT